MYLGRRTLLVDYGILRSVLLVNLENTGATNHSERSVAIPLFLFERLLSHHRTRPTNFSALHHSVHLIRCRACLPPWSPRPAPYKEKLKKAWPWAPSMEMTEPLMIVASRSASKKRIGTYSSACGIRPWGRVLTNSRYSSGL